MQVRYHTQLAVCTCCACLAENMMRKYQQFPQSRYVSPYCLGLVFLVVGRPLFRTTKSFMDV